MYAYQFTLKILRSGTDTTAIIERMYAGLVVVDNNKEALLERANEFLRLCEVVVDTNKKLEKEVVAVWNVIDNAIGRVSMSGVLCGAPLRD